MSDQVQGSQAVPSPAAEAEGVTGTVVFDGQLVTIRRTSDMARMTVGLGEKRIPVGSITAIEWKPAGILRGFIRFTVSGGNERRSPARTRRRDAVKDEDSVVFARFQQAAFKRLRAAIEAAR